MSTSQLSTALSSLSSSSLSSASAVSSSSGVSVGGQYEQRVLSILYLSFSVLSLVLSLTVILSYALFRSLRQHPNSFVFWRSLCDSLYSLQFVIFFTIQPPSSRHDYCRLFTPLFQFSLLSSQCWYTVLALDLLLSMRNPFLSLSSSPLYHLFVWPTALLSAVIIPLSGQQGYRPGLEICWIRASETSTVNLLTWAVFFIPTLLSFVFALLVMAYASTRLRQGLRESFNTRTAVLHNSLRYVASFSLYWSITAGIYLTIWWYEQGTHEQGPAAQPPAPFGVYAAFAVTLVLRAALDEVVWCYNNSVAERWTRWWRGERQLRPVSTDINRALRREVLLYTTSGIVCAAELQQRQQDKKSSLSLLPAPKAAQFPSSLSSTSSAATRHLRLRPRAAEGSSTSPSSSFSSSSSSPTPFTDYAPYVFSYLRSLWCISTDSYVTSVRGDMDAMLERFTEGRSAAFFYYSQDGRFIVKTLSRSEAELLIELLPSYAAYMSAQPNSLLSRFVGFHSVCLYSLTLYFVVMQSVFVTRLAIHERYDLKGSSVDRLTGREGKQSGKVLKDLDLTANLILAADDRQSFLLQCEHDSLFLCQHAIMDYSLLLGIHFTHHKVGLQTDIEAQSSPSSPTLSSPSASGSTGAPGRTVFQRDAGGLRATVIAGPSLYLFGIIDVLQRYNWKKRAERWSKALLRCKDRRLLSAMPPRKYRERFVQAMQRITEEEQTVEFRSALSTARREGQREGDDAAKQKPVGRRALSLGGQRAGRMLRDILLGDDQEEEEDEQEAEAAVHGRRQRADRSRGDQRRG